MTITARVLLVEDHPVVLRGLRALIDDEDDLLVDGEVTTSDQAIAAARRTGPDLVVVPMRLGGTFRGARLCRSIKEVCAARVVVFTSFTRPIDVRLSLLAGADAVIAKTADIGSIVHILRATAAGGPPLVLGPGAVTPVAQARRTLVEELTARELDILELVAEGLRNEDIAARLHIGVTTVKTHVSSALHKLGAASRRELLHGLDGSTAGGTATITGSPGPALGVGGP
jgi:DNA-binding NarL/FixJ family response regulator